MSSSVSVRIINGTLVESTVLFTNPAGTGTDPALITVSWKAPDGTVTSLVYGIDSEVVRTAAGRYQCDFLPAQTGEWIVQWSGEGLAVGYKAFRIQAAAIHL